MCSARPVSTVIYIMPYLSLSFLLGPLVFLTSHNPSFDCFSPSACVSFSCWHRCYMSPAQTRDVSTPKVSPLQIARLCLAILAQQKAHVACVSLASMGLDRHAHTLQASNKGNGDICIQGGLCYAQQGSYSGYIYGNGCTDSTFSDQSCPYACPMASKQTSTTQSSLTSLTSFHRAKWMESLQRAALRTRHMVLP